MHIYKCDGCERISEPTRLKSTPKEWGLVSFYYTFRGSCRLVDHHFCQACSKRLRITQQECDEQSQADRLLGILTDIADEAVENHSDN